MSEDALSRPTSVHSSGVVSSNEDLSQKYQKLFQEYSKIKAQHSVLKKAVIKEQATNSVLQGDLKSKEQQLRKTQEELDLLIFHNDRLTRRIESLQSDVSNKGSFSLLGGALKKELELSKLALEAANLDLQAKIDENEKLHRELSESNSIHSQRMDELQALVQPLEKKLAEAVETVKARGENEELLSEARKEKMILETELAKVKLELQDTMKLIGNNEDAMRKNDTKLHTEIQLLRSVLLTKLEDIESTSIDYHDLSQETQSAIDTFSGKSVNMIQKLRELEDKMQKNEEERAILKKSLDKETTRASAFQTEIRILNEKIREKESEIIAKQNELVARQVEINFESSSVYAGTSPDNSSSVKDDKQLKAQIEELRRTIEELDEQNRSQRADLARMKALSSSQPSNTSKMSEEAEGDPTTLPVVNANEDDDEPFVYQPLEDSNTESIGKQAKEESDEFVYAGEDAVLSVTSSDIQPIKDSNIPQEVSKENANEVMTIDSATSTSGAELKENGKDLKVKEVNTLDTKNIPSTPSEEVVQPQLRFISKQSNRVSPPATEYTRENLIKNHYEAKLHQLTEQLQLSDSKSVRYHKAEQIMKEKLATSESENERLRQEAETLKRNIMKLQDELATTESNYKSQLDIMTEHITHMQQLPQNS